MFCEQYGNHPIATPTTSETCGNSEVSQSVAVLVSLPVTTRNIYCFALLSFLESYWLACVNSTTQNIDPAATDAIE